MIQFLILISVGLVTIIICILNAHKKEIWEILNGNKREDVGSNVRNRRK